jgi:hypothetical protein
MDRLSLTERRRRHGISKDNLNNVTFYGLIAFIIGDDFICFVKHPFPSKVRSASSPSTPISDPFGASAVAFIVAMIYGQRRKLLFGTPRRTYPFFATLH